jgi:hypothetical protein
MPNNNNSKVNQIIDASQSLSNKQKRVQIRKNAQQTLLYLHDVIAKKNERYYTGDPSSTKRPPLTKDSHDAVPAPLANGSWRSGYRNIIPVEKDQYADGVSPLTSLGENINKFFSFELTSAQQAALYPKLRLYKILYELDGKGNIKLPAKEKSKDEIIFEKAITSKELDILTARGGNIGSSGIESFEWKLMGVNPADTDSNIEASLKIYFNNVGVFAERIENLRAAADIEAAVPVGPRTLAQQNILDSAKKAHFLDLITFAPPTTKNTNSLPCNEVYDPSYFEILAEVGWEAPEGSLRLFNSQQVEHIKNQTVKLYLTLTDHKFDFKEDGSATLVANYRARQNFSDPDFDLLYPRGELAAAIGNLNNLKTDENIKPEDKAKEEEKQQEDLLNLLKENYKRIISGLLDNLYEAEIPNTLLLNSILPVRTVKSITGNPLGKTLRSQTLSWNQLLELLQRQDSLKRNYINSPSARSGAFSPYRDVELENAITDIQNKIAAASNIKVNRRILAGDVTERFTERGGTINRTLNTDDYLSDDSTAFDNDIKAADITFTRNSINKIQFFYLGDILEVMLETVALSKLLFEKKVAFITTDFEYINLFKIIKDLKSNKSGDLTISTIQNFDFSKLKCAEKTFKKSDFKNFYSVLNVANIPIEATAFLDFFTEKIVAQERQNYYLNNFLADLFTQLVKPALGDNAVQGMPNNQPALINTDVSAVDNVNSPLFQNPPFTPRNRINNPTRDNEYKLVFDSSVESQYTSIKTIKDYQDAAPLKGQVLFQNPPSNITNNVTTVKIIGINGGMNYLDGKYHTNIKEGITNFVVGLDRGIIKSVSFERVDQPYLREARTATDKSFGVGQLRELYNVNLTLYGNNLVKPGQMIYVEPNRFVFGRPTEISSVSRLLGLGGYHLVVDVSNTIGKDGWETSVRALHMAMPAIVD